MPLSERRGERLLLMKPKKVLHENQGKEGKPRSHRQSRHRRKEAALDEVRVITQQKVKSLGKQMPGMIGKYDPCQKNAFM